VARSGSRRVVGLPVEATSFVGRRPELAEAKRLLTAARLVTLTGPGGVGKTRLGVRLAQQVAHAFPDGVWFVQLAAVQDDAIVAHAVADALGLRDEGDRPPLDVLVEHLAGRRLLLVLDNCEQVRDACAALIGRVLAATDGPRVLATSRHRLGLAEEHLLPVPPLRVPAQGAPLHQGDSDEFAALQLFADRAAAVVPGFAIGAENHAAVARLCRRLDGLPLAIELAAVRMRVLGVDQLVERLDDRFRLLTAGSPVASPRHQTLRSAVDWSHDLCTPREQLAWARLAVFAGSFDLNAAEAVCAGRGLDRAEVLDAVAGLLEKSILVREDAGHTVRYRLLAILRQYGLERLEASGELVEVRRLLRDHVLHLVEESARKWFGPDQAAIVATVRAEQDNLRASLDFCLGTPGESRQGIRLVAGLWFYWAARAVWVEARHWWNRLVQVGDAPSTAALARWQAMQLRVIHNRSSAVILAGTPPAPPGGPDGPPTVKPLADLMTSGRGGAEGLESFHVLNRVELACTLVSRGRPEHAVPLCTEAVEICELHGEQWTRSYALRTLAMAQWALGDDDAAVESARRCLRLPYVTAESHAVGRTLELLAVITAGQGDPERAVALQGAAHGIWHDIGYDPLSEQQWGGRVRAVERLGRTALGDPAYERAYRRGTELTAQEAVAYALRDRPGPPPRARTVHKTAGTELTAREREVANLIAAGMTNRRIAETLVISPRTAEGHVERILSKLGFTARSQVAAWVEGQGRTNRAE
jgi:predicted ATPase/DNA-binding CsgD family transcriptional regulator